MSDNIAEQVRDELDPTPASEVDWPVSRRRVLQAVASVGALSLGGGSAQAQAGTVIADEAFLSNYGVTETADGWQITIEGDVYGFPRDSKVVLPNGDEGNILETPDAPATDVIAPDGTIVFGTPEAAVLAFGGQSASASGSQYRDGSWSALPDMPTGRGDFATTTTTTGGVIAIGGFDIDFNALNTVEVWDGFAWEALPDLPTARALFDAARDGAGNILAIGGDDGSGEVATVERWDGSSWSSLPDLPTPRSRLGAARDGAGNILAIGGNSGGISTTAAVDQWDGSSWSSLPDMPTARSSPGVTQDNGNVYAVGGYDGSVTGAFERWDGSSWSSLPDMPTPRSTVGCAIDANGYLLAIGGDDGSGEVATVERWDGSVWTSLPDLPTPRDDHAVAAFDP